MKEYRQAGKDEVMFTVPVKIILDMCGLPLNLPVLDVFVSGNLLEIRSVASDVEEMNLAVDSRSRSVLSRIRQVEGKREFTWHKNGEVKSL